MKIAMPDETIMAGPPTLTTTTPWSSSLPALCCSCCSLNGRQLLAASFSLMMVLSSFSSCSAFAIQTTTTSSASSTEEESPFYLPTDEALRQFQQIVLRGLGLTKVPDLSKANISREEYDRQRQLVQLDHDHEEELDDQLSSYTDEYRQFQPEEQREILILNHREVKSDLTNGVKWQLQFRQQSTESPMQPESLHLHWSLPGSSSSRRRSSAARRPHWKLHVRIPGIKSVLLVIKASDVVYDDEGRTASVRLDETDLRSLFNQRRLRKTMTTVRVSCRGRDCSSLRRWRLGAQLRLIEQESDLTKRFLRNKRHSGSAGGGKKNKKMTTITTTTTRRPQPQPKEIFQQQLTKDKKSSSSSSSSSSMPSSCSSKGSGNGKRCCPHSLKINLRQLPGFDWILEPAEIDIYMCKGDCHYAQLVGQQQQQQLQQQQQQSTTSGKSSVGAVSSNHALFQGYLHTVDKRRVPKLCCTASKLSSVQIVHYDQDDPSKLTTTRWEGAIVKECACA